MAYFVLESMDFVELHRIFGLHHPLVGEILLIGFFVNAHQIFASIISLLLSTMRIEFSQHCLCFLVLLFCLKSIYLCGNVVNNILLEIFQKISQFCSGHTRVRLV